MVLLKWGDSQEGETPVSEPEYLLDRSITTRRELDMAEAANVRDAAVKYLAAKPSSSLATFKYEWVLQLHGEMFGNVWKWGGQIRNHDLLNFGVPHYTIRERLYSLCEDFEYWREHWEDDLETAAHIHHKAVIIHPFDGGNGRWSRMLADIYLRQCGRKPILWPVDFRYQESAIRREYLDAIHAANDGNYTQLIELYRAHAPDAEN